MFTKGQKVVDQNGKVFVVESVSEKDFGSGRENYLTLRPCFPGDFSAGYCSYVPERLADTLIRSIRTKKRRDERRCAYLERQPISFKSPRERKRYFEQVIHSRDAEELLRAYKSLVSYRKERREKKKSFSDFDRVQLDRITKIISEERAAVLDTGPEEAKNYLEERAKENAQAC